MFPVISPYLGQRFRSRDQLTLGELNDQLAKLKLRKGKEEISYEFQVNGLSVKLSTVDSYRGYYVDLAIHAVLGAYTDFSRFRQTLKKAQGKTFEGWKGGDYLMGQDTPLWLAPEGHCGNVCLVGVEIHKYNDTYYVIELEAKAED